MPPFAHQLASCRVAAAFVWMLTGLAACSRETAVTTQTTSTVAAPDEIALLARVVDRANIPMPNSHLLVAQVVNCSEDHSPRPRPYNTSKVLTNGEGRFTLRIRRQAPEGCEHWLTVGPSREVLDGVLDPRASLTIPLPARIDGAEFDLGDLRMVPVGSGRPYESLRDDELERALPTAQITSLSSPRFELETLLTEMIFRGSPSFVPFLEGQLFALRADSANPVSKRREFFVRTALRRLQNRPDPLQIRVIDAALPSEFPEIPVMHVQMTNVDEPGTTLVVIEDCRWWCEYWFVEVRTPAGERVPKRISPFIGSTGYDPRRTLAPGEFATDRIDLAQRADFSAAGTYEARLHFLEEESISDELHLENRIVSSSAWTRFEILPRTVRATRAELERARAAIDAVDGSTPVRLKYTTFDPVRPFKAEARTSEEVLWALGWKSLQPLLDALDRKSITPHQRAWILAQLCNLTGLHDPGVQRGVLGDFQRINAWFVEKEGAWHVDDVGSAWNFGFDEARQIEFAQRWKRSGESFRFEASD